MIPPIGHFGAHGIPSSEFQNLNTWGTDLIPEYRLKPLLEYLKEQEQPEPPPFTPVPPDLTMAASSSPNKLVMLVSPSPPDDYVQYQMTIRKYPTQGDCRSPPDPTGRGSGSHTQIPGYPDLQSTTLSEVTLPINEAILKVAKDISETPDNCAPTTKRAKKEIFCPLKKGQNIYSFTQPRNL